MLNAPAFSPIALLSCLDGELAAVASSRVCLVAAGFGCQVLGYHARRGIWVCDRLWHCTACSCEAPWGGVRSSCLLHGRALADHSASQFGIRNPLWPLWVGSDTDILFCFCFILHLQNCLTQEMTLHQKLVLPSASLLSGGSEQILLEMLNAQISTNQEEVVSGDLLNLFCEL